MPALTRRESTSQSSSRDSRSWSGSDSYETHSTAPTSTYTSARPFEYKASGPESNDGSYYSRERGLKHQGPHADGQEVSPGTSLYPRSSVDTYASTTASEEDLDAIYPDPGTDSYAGYESDSIPPLPVYRREVIEPNVHTSTPPEFARLFPSLNRFSIRHDEFTPDGNMNLRIDTIVTGRRRTAVQLFHLRMYDLAKREFSLRRYCRDSGREVCNSKRKYLEAAAPKQTKEDETGRPSLQRSVTSAIKSLGGSSGKPGFSRTNSGGSIFGPRSPGGNADKELALGPSRSYSSSGDHDDSCDRDVSRESLTETPFALKSKRQHPVPTNTIKLEFSNYARVDVHRRGGSKNKRYEFEWWGHRYSWKRTVDKQLGLKSFHLVRDGNANAAVAHIVPETRSPSQVVADECAGGWVPPCFMWFTDESILDALTDVADVIMATGLMALVDNCIKERWQTKKAVRIPVPLTSKTVGVAPKALMQHVFGRRNSNEQDYHPSSPSSLRHMHPISAY